MGNLLVTSSKTSHITVPTALGTFILLPGVNEVDAAQWDEATKYPTNLLSIQTAAGEFVVQRSESVADLKLDAALSTIKAAYSLDLLATWRDAEMNASKRKVVLAAIDTQVKLITEQMAAAAKDNK